MYGEQDKKKEPAKSDQEKEKEMNLRNCKKIRKLQTFTISYR